MSSVGVSQRYAEASTSAAPKAFGGLWPFLQFSFNGLIVAQLYYIASSVAAISFFQSLGDKALPAQLRGAEAVINLHQGAASLIAGGFALAALVAYCRFYYRAVRNLQISRATAIAASPSWAVGVHFVPVLNLWKPLAIIRQTWSASHDPYVATVNAPRLILWWWVATLVAALFGGGSMVAAWNAGFYGYGITDRALYLDSLTLHIISSIAAIIAAALVIEVSAGIRQAQNAKVLPAGQRIAFGQA